MTSEALEAGIAALEFRARQWHGTGKNCAEFLEPAIELRKLSTELEALRADAARYKWLRSGPDLHKAGILKCGWVEIQSALDVEMEDGPELDAAIDSAIDARLKGNGS